MFTVGLYHICINLLWLEFTYNRIFYNSLCYVTWWRDIIREATFEDTSTNSSKGLRLGMIYFIVSRSDVFFAFGHFFILV
jgi:heme/copper-type cytochrome/quinol oxidase subunit 3